MDILLECINWIRENLLKEIIYDLVKIIIGFIIARVLYENVYTKLRWGGWRIRIKKGAEVLMTRDIRPEKAQQIMNDGADFSVFVKGVASTYFWINQNDMSLEQVNKTDLLKLDKKKKIIIIDQAHNPPKVKKGVSNEQLLKTLQTMQQRLDALSNTSDKK